jgi:hypothetical protein
MVVMNLITNKDQNILTKKIKYLLNSFFITPELIATLSWKKIYKLLKLSTKYNNQFNWTKKDLKLIAKELKEFNFEKKSKNLNILATLIEYKVKIIFRFTLKLIFTKKIISFFNFINFYPITLE